MMGYWLISLVGRVFANGPGDLTKYKRPYKIQKTLQNTKDLKKGT